jgi:hypothetical protein
LLKRTDCHSWHSWHNLVERACLGWCLGDACQTTRPRMAEAQETKNCRRVHWGPPEPEDQMYPDIFI